MIVGQTEYRRLATECFATAYTIATEETRATLIQMAQVWLRLAEKQDMLPPAKSSRWILFSQASSLKGKAIL
jgi:hypothetical protein